MAVQTFQRFIDQVLRGLTFTFVFLDDTLIAVCALPPLSRTQTFDTGARTLLFVPHLLLHSNHVHPAKLAA